MLDRLQAYDTLLFLFLNNLGSEPYDGFWLVLTNKWASIPLYVVLLYLVYRKYALKGTLWVLLCAAVLVAASDQLANLFKYILVQRPRPCQVDTLKEQMRLVAQVCGRFGYYSAHSSGSMAIAVFIGLIFRSRYRYLPFILLLWAVLIGYSRIYLGVHYPLDVISGMAFGGFLGWLAYQLQQWGQRRFAKA